MSRLEYWLNILVAMAFVVIYIVKGSTDVLWLFCATFQIIHTKADQILAELKKGKE
ncbi:membrane protein [Arthrobacter phage Bauer]|uniref:Membrane protein n=1 Tax=Arthrobacter phage Bauer TaxID=2985648 RepID=A0A9E7V2M7_9CAUD|nr:membrane protein [Arthrobacter phage Bauer]UYM26636.1 membrane protein [Arthrobacter phage Bauer]